MVALNTSVYAFVTCFSPGGMIIRAGPDISKDGVGRLWVVKYVLTIVVASEMAAASERILVEGVMFNMNWSLCIQRK